MERKADRIIQMAEVSSVNPSNLIHVDFANVGKLEGQPDHKIKFEGFTNPEHQNFVKEKLDVIGLPTHNIHTLRFIDATKYIDAKNEWFALGHFDRKGEFALYKAWKENLPEIAQMGTMVHELAHANSAFEEENDNLYGGRENRLRVLKHATEIARQTTESGVFINSYHKKLAQMLEAGAIDNKRFIEETHAIIIETRFTNAKHLDQVEESQRESMAISGKDFVDITAGVDQTLIDLLGKNHPEITTSEDLEDHIQEVRSSFMPKQARKAA